MDPAGYVKSLPPSGSPARPVLGTRWQAWAASAVVVVVAQVVMWNGWNGSGEWIPVTGTRALQAYAFNGALCAAPVVCALVALRRWLSLFAILLALLYFGVSTGRFLETSESSTAGFAWFAPLVSGLPVVFAVWLTERILTRLTSR